MGCGNITVVIELRFIGAKKLSVRLFTFFLSFIFGGKYSTEYIEAVTSDA